MERWAVHEVTLELPLKPSSTVPVQVYAIVDLGVDADGREAELKKGKALRGWAVRAFFAEKHDANFFVDFLNAIADGASEELLAALEGNDIPKAH